ncbi:MAG: (2Fe-2S)-binding protein [Dehalococcoidales bacterium]|jgi:aerobic-type carbon monoxide dehydrogenase small subunit (CoxS/CutS family)|nr:(2Fe-2S)-binding protein [Dehalococcoidales bacterium]MDD4465881.1 (2Fe-2S)-binding protein [Dehalococcoidales bacterium]MDD5402357.1 (2Fe-2S)-binding protein [Dehalococcoidales bacterium]
MVEEKDNNRQPGNISRRQFLKDAGIVVGGTAVSSAFFLSACGKEVEVTKTITTTAPGTTSTVTKTAADNTVTITKYTCPVCSQEFDSLAALKAHFDADHSETEAKKDTINLTINGNEYTDIHVKPHWTLRELLHDKLEFVDIKEMCSGRGACGSCSVLMDGRPILSCLTLASTCDGAVIETAYGIANSKHPLIEAYIKNHCMQCGYCTPGFLVTAKALLENNPNPTEADIRNALGGNLCRCGTYPAHIDAILEAANVKGGA